MQVHTVSGQHTFLSQNRSVYISACISASKICYLCR